jgi:hypothetical protein
MHIYLYPNASFMLLGALAFLLTVEICASSIIVPSYIQYPKANVEIFASTLFINNVLVTGGVCNASTAQAADYFWTQLLQSAASASDRQLYLTLLKNCNEVLTGRAEAMLKTKANTIVMALNTIEELDQAQLDFGVPYSANVRFRIAVLNTSDETSTGLGLMSTSVKQYLEAACNSSNMQLLAMAGWYLVTQDTWIQVHPYPDGERKCEAREIQKSADVKDSKVEALRNFNGHQLTVSTVKYPPFVDYLPPALGTSRTLDLGAVTGNDFDLLKLFQSRLNYTIKAVVPEDEDWGADDGNGSWTGIIGMVKSREADVGASGLVGVPTSRTAIRYASLISIVLTVPELED